ncbi:hypothetical protein HNO86_22405 [Pseudomonas sp. C1C7]|uniref:hypothetical protein n=1 Tax=Pseudomonas sp. C1C7 TaxID=2735272 RepID=UPI0015864756|nr:hypothetical protein [Pseudomonas sp. C1C7]NUT77805.1 hypothetical protein [Pseudomonas sp. C1C7]
MKLTTPLAALIISTSLLGCATSSSDSGINVPLTATRHNAGQIGNVTLTDLEQKTGLSFFISGVPNGVLLPLRVQSFIYKGNCQQPGAVAFGMNEQVNTERQPVKGWTFSRIAPVARSELLSGDYSVVVRSTADSGNLDLFCGDIKQANPVK